MPAKEEAAATAAVRWDVKAAAGVDAAVEAEVPVEVAAGMQHLKWSAKAEASTRLATPVLRRVLRGWNEQWSEEVAAEAAEGAIEFQEASATSASTSAIHSASAHSAPPLTHSPSILDVGSGIWTYAHNYASVRRVPAMHQVAVTKKASPIKHASAHCSESNLDLPPQVVGRVDSFGNVRGDLCSINLAGACTAGRCQRGRFGRERGGARAAALPCGE